MAASKKKKVIRFKDPENKSVVQRCDPDAYYQEHPSWSFSSCDSNLWSLTSAESKNLFWVEIFPRLKSWETQTWNDIFLSAKKQNHSIETASLNLVARKRLIDLHLEPESILSLRLTATHRIYGYNIGGVFHILWFDTKHEDNDSCVCRSHKKHT